MTLDQKVEKNTKNIDFIKREVKILKQHAIKNQADHKIMAEKVDTLNANVIKLMTTVMDKI